MTEAQIDEWKNKAVKVYSMLPCNPSPEKLAAAIQEGLIPKKNLKDRVHYVGECRNAWIAVWSAEIGLFIHWRYKFGYYLEDIPHPENCDGYDIFTPVREVTEADIGPNDGKVKRLVEPTDFDAYVKKHLKWLEDRKKYAEKHK